MWEKDKITGKYSNIKTIKKIRVKSTIIREKDRITIKQNLIALESHGRIKK